MLAGPYLALVLVGCGALELRCRRAGGWRPAARALSSVSAVAAVIAAGGFGALAWTALKVGALSFGGGFVIIPLMQGDAVHVYHWMTNAQFLNAVALGQVTPGPVVATVAAVGYAAHGVAGRGDGGGDRVRAVVRVRPARRTAVRQRCVSDPARARFSTAPDRRRSAPSPAPRSHSALALGEAWQFARAGGGRRGAAGGSAAGS